MNEVLKRIDLVNVNKATVVKVTVLFRNIFK
jgi:hypothetical protein